MKKMDRSFSFAIMGLVALVLYMLLEGDPNTPMTLKLSLGTLALFLFILSMVGYRKKKNTSKK